MLAASFWSLLQPAIDLVRETESTNWSGGSLCYLPPAIGLLVGALFIIVADYFFPEHVRIPMFYTVLSYLLIVC